MINPDASQGAAVALVAGDDGLDLDLRSQLDPAPRQAAPGLLLGLPFLRARRSPARCPRDSLGYVGIGDPGTTLRSLLKQASATEPGLAAAVGDLVERVRKLGEVDLEKDLLPSLGGEAAIALAAGRATARRSRSSSSSPPTSTPTGRARRWPAFRARSPRRSIPPRALQAPVVREHEVGGLTAHSVRLSPTVDLTYAIEGSTLVVATDPAAVEQLASGEGGLDGEELFDRATDGLPGELSMLGYLDLGGLIALGESAGLGEDPAYADLRLRDPEAARRSAWRSSRARRSSPRTLA